MGCRCSGVSNPIRIPERRAAGGVWGMPPPTCDAPRVLAVCTSCRPLPGKIVVSDTAALSHLVRGGPLPGLARMAGLIKSSLPDPPGPGPCLRSVAGSARARARDPARFAPRTTGPNGPNRMPSGAVRSLGPLPPTALPCAARLNIPGVSGCFELRARATIQRATASDRSLAARGSRRIRPVAWQCRCGPAAAGPQLPCLPRSGLCIDSRAVSTPTRAVSTSNAPTVSMSFTPLCQFPVAHRPSVPRWLSGLGGPPAVSTPACVARPCPRQPSPIRHLGPARPAP